MTAQQLQRAEQVGVAVHVLAKLAEDWDEDVHFKMRDPQWLARTLDSYTAKLDLAAAEAELIPLARTLHSLTQTGGSRAIHTAMLDRVRIALKYLSGEQ